jgi:hypothetical protein
MTQTDYTTLHSKTSEIVGLCATSDDPDMWFPEVPQGRARGMTEDEIIPYCDTCNQPMSRVYSAPPVKFNATGFYSTGG